MRLHSTQSQHILAVLLPEGLAPEMVTVSAKKGARLAVVADLWHREHDCEYLPPPHPLLPLAFSWTRMRGETKVYKCGAYAP